MAKRILIVDDDADIRQASRIVLAGAGYEVLEAESAAKALAVLAKESVDLVLLDVMMETQTEGFHLAYRIREDSRLKHLPIIMLTSIEQQMGQKLEPEKAGDFLPVQGFLRKPLDPAQLKEKVAKLLADG